MSAHFKVNVDCKTTISCLLDQCNWIFVTHMWWQDMDHCTFDGVSWGSQITQFLWQNFEFRVRAIKSLQICSLKPSELCAISFTFFVFLCCDVSFMRYLSSVYVAKNARVKKFCWTASLIQYGDIYHEGLIPSTTDLRDLTQYKYAKQIVLLKHLFKCYHQFNHRFHLIWNDMSYKMWAYKGWKMFQRYLIFQNCVFLSLSFLFWENFQTCKENGAHIQESTIFKNEVSF